MNGGSEESVILYTQKKDVGAEMSEGGGGRNCCLNNL